MIDFFSLNLFSSLFIIYMFYGLIDISWWFFYTIGWNLEAKLSLRNEIVKSDELVN